MTQITIKHLLSTDNTSLQTLLVKINQLQHWQQYLLTHFPNEKKLFEHCHLIRLQQSVLHVIADNANWSTKFGYLIPQLLEILRQHPDFQGLKHIQCKVRPPHYLPPDHKRKALQPSKENKALWDETRLSIKKLIKSDR